MIISENALHFDSQRISVKHACPLPKEKKNTQEHSMLMFTILLKPYKKNLLGKSSMLYIWSFSHHSHRSYQPICNNTVSNKQISYILLSQTCTPTQTGHDLHQELTLSSKVTNKGTNRNWPCPAKSPMKRQTSENGFATSRKSKLPRNKATEQHWHCPESWPMVSSKSNTKVEGWKKQFWN